MNSIMIIAAVFLGCVAFNQALHCYSHPPCLNDCPQLSTTNKTCDRGKDKCYTAITSDGVSRGCAKDQCTIKIHGNPVEADICCEGDLCNSNSNSNSAITPKMTITTILMILSVFIFARM